MLVWGRRGRWDHRPLGRDRPVFGRSFHRLLGRGLQASNRWWGRTSLLRGLRVR